MSTDVQMCRNKAIDQILITCLPSTLRSGKKALNRSLHLEGGGGHVVTFMIIYMYEINQNGLDLFYKICLKERAVQGDLFIIILTVF